MSYNLGILKTLLCDRKFRVPRMWSNNELKKFAHLFSGRVINVSGWKDIDKEGSRYKDYFVNAEEYWISNYKSEYRGFQGTLENEIFLDLTQPLPKELRHKFDVVFNHTTLEHIFDVFTAFKNLCELSKDIVIIVVPFIQEQHADYGDYWRFTPLAIRELFKRNGLELIYINFNDWSNSSIYIFAIGSRHPDKWEKIRNHPDNKLNYIDNYFVGTKIIRNSILYNIFTITKNCLQYLKNLRYKIKMRNVKR
ncbi:methyltransferase domain-containing protein [Thermococcus eurythermalis]|uniref:hypothetical protein n=1 Tax=Thermococcus eurythermalis TaxID=1505907 RepID=UPI00157ADD4C|nr:hypothetical protein [Thermococcus eurythermalis]